MSKFVINIIATYVATYIIYSYNGATYGGLYSNMIVATTATIFGNSVAKIR